MKGQITQWKEKEKFFVSGWNAVVWKHFCNKVILDLLGAVKEVYTFLMNKLLIGLNVNNWVGAQENKNTLTGLVNILGVNQNVIGHTHDGGHRLDLVLTSGLSAKKYSRVSTVRSYFR